MTLIPRFILLVWMVMMFSGCQTRHEVDVKPVEVKPIHITIDVNIKVQKALDDFFSDIDAQEDEIMEELEEKKNED
ncbi:YnbE-like lipoprotein [Desulfotignum phosphitoxidans DSM 13687]|uniref:YnbE-like lipoprotein n=2 Tax=Desulfotignum phosphitoxidans TaxID=190898 RepID=S0G6V7_9BACT|nr:YnbE-like lipoprotein [Desulfotignum phosphitoxidans DSM 13687]